MPSKFNMRRSHQTRTDLLIRVITTNRTTNASQRVEMRDEDTKRIMLSKQLSFRERRDKMALNVGWNGKLLFVESKLPVMKRPEDNAPRNISTTSDEPDRKTAAKADPTLEADNDRAATSSENNEGGVSSENNEEFIRQWEQEAHLHFKKSSYWKGESLTAIV